MNIVYSKQAAKFINSLDTPTKLRFKSAIDGLTETPPKGDIKQLQGYNITSYRLRIGKYRIIYRFDVDKAKQEILFISDIGSRGDIYK